MAIVAIFLFEGREKRAAIGGRIVLACSEANSLASPVSSAIVEKD